jgi:hypothetical protein
MDAQITELAKKRPRGRQRGSQIAPGLKRTSSRRPSDLVSIEKNSGAARFFDKMIREIEQDLGGRRHLTRIEGELIRAFCGAATTLQYLNHQVLLGEVSEIDLSGYATIASTILRIGSKLGLQRRARDVTPTLDQYLRAKEVVK